jgi:hypothetical protein
VRFAYTSFAEVTEDGLAPKGISGETKFAGGIDRADIVDNFFHRGFLCFGLSKSWSTDSSSSVNMIFEALMSFLSFSWEDANVRLDLTRMYDLGFVV